MKLKILLILLVSFISCEKENEDNSSPKNVDINYILNEKWYIYSITSDEPTTFTGFDYGSDILIQNEECSLDDYIIFKKLDSLLNFRVYDDEESCLEDDSFDSYLEWSNTYDHIGFDLEYSESNGYLNSLYFTNGSQNFHWLFDGVINRLDNIKGYEDGIYKKLIAKSYIFYGNESIVITYELISYFNDTPEEDE